MSVHCNLTPFQSKLILDYLPPVENTTYADSVFHARRYAAALESLAESAKGDLGSRREPDALLDALADTERNGVR